MDKRPDPKPRKNPQLWQSYLLWNELMEMRKRHNLRISSAEAGKSQMDASLERTFMKDLGLEGNLNNAKNMMIDYGGEVGPIWDWVTSIKGLASGAQAAKLLAQIDDIKRFDTVSKLWRFAGWAVIDGQAEKNQKGQKSHYNRELKAICFVIGDLFIKQRTPYYRDIYDAEKARQRELHPETICKQCGINWKECKSKKTHKKAYNDGHLHHRAMRKMIKEFLKDLYIAWNEYEK